MFSIMTNVSPGREKKKFKVWSTQNDQPTGAEGTKRQPECRCDTSAKKISKSDAENMILPEACSFRTHRFQGYPMGNAPLRIDPACCTSLTDSAAHTSSDTDGWDD
jgi:hypothetical protein